MSEFELPDFDEDGEELELPGLDDDEDHDPVSGLELPDLSGLFEDSSDDSAPTSRRDPAEERVETVRNWKAEISRASARRAVTPEVASALRDAINSSEVQDTLLGGSSTISTSVLRTIKGIDADADFRDSLSNFSFGDSFLELVEKVHGDVERDEDEVEVLGEDSLDSLLEGLAEEDDEDEDEDLSRVDAESMYSYYESTDDEDLLEGFDLDTVLADAIDADASDIHLSPGFPVTFTVLGQVTKHAHYTPLTGTMTQRIIQGILTNVLETSFIENLELDTSYVLKTGRYKGRRTRLSVGKTINEVFMVFRVISDEIPTPDKLGVPEEMIRWTDLSNGLVMMNGPTGAGKSLTLASLLRRIQLDRPSKIITIEKPVEFLYGPEGKAFVTQREVGKDSKSFAGALTSAMRQAPNIIMVGEVRNQEEVNELLRAAETGHLAISTMHTDSAARTVGRIRSLYQGNEQLRILGSFSEAARGLANQVLVLSPDATFRTAVREILTVDEEVRKLIAIGDASGVRGYQVDHEITMEHELMRAVDAGLCTVEEARRKTAYPDYLEKLIKRAG